MSADFIANFIQKCASSGKATPDEICTEALNEIEILEKQIHEADLARIKRTNLIKVLKSFNHKSVFNVRNSKISPVTNMETQASASSATESFMAKICDYIEKYETCTSGDILRNIGDYKHNEITFSSIKILCERKVLQQTEDRQLIKGENWDSRPK